MEKLSLTVEAPMTAALAPALRQNFPKWCEVDRQHARVPGRLAAAGVYLCACALAAGVLGETPSGERRWRLRTVAVYWGGFQSPNGRKSTRTARNSRRFEKQKHDGATVGALTQETAGR